AGASFAPSRTASTDVSARTPTHQVAAAIPSNPVNVLRICVPQASSVAQSALAPSRKIVSQLERGGALDQPLGQTGCGLVVAWVLYCDPDGHSRVTEFAARRLRGSNRQISFAFCARADRRARGRAVLVRAAQLGAQRP